MCVGFGWVTSEKEVMPQSEKSLCLEIQLVFEGGLHFAGISILVKMYTQRTVNVI